MTKTTIEIAGHRLACFSLNTLIIGSGAAALNTAVHLVEQGQTDCAIATDRWGGGTSNNTGSDKQTYYKLSLSGDQADSVRDMAQDLFRGGCMHGDIALCEAQNSARAFFHLVELGVPFPHSRHGGYVGYKTDHDPRQRATSAGPLTSQLMFESLARKVKEQRIRVFDRHEVIALLTRGTREGREAVGALALDLDGREGEDPRFVVFNARNLVLGTGGPAGIYATSVYPESQLGSTGMAFAAGAAGHNLTESQFGLASIRFRWNLSGTYQQVLPRYISTDQEGGDEQEFLNRFFPDMGTMATAIFLKGYQWPFDPRKVRDYGSSLIDILVYRETVAQGRRVFLDFTRNPTGAGTLDPFAFDKLSPEAFAYLERSGALYGTPIERLKKMNQPAIDLYRDQGIDISAEPLEIAVCAQHNNGGLSANVWWESNLRHLFPVGEVCGTHGVYRPGGSALNSGQVGGLRASQFIARRYTQLPLEISAFLKAAQAQIEEKLEWAGNVLDPSLAEDLWLRDTRRELQERMTEQGAHIRNPESVSHACSQAWALFDRLKSETKISSPQKWAEAFKNLDLGLTHALYLEAVAEYLKRGGKSRGSYLVVDPEGEKSCPALGDEWRFRLTSEEDYVNRNICQVSLDETGKPGVEWVPVRPLPVEDTWFENVWNAYRQDKIIVREEGRSS
jgi:succinate dehydrogenase/fumarate reductase flavoprotein subunit